MRGRWLTDGAEGAHFNAETLTAEPDRLQPDVSLVLLADIFQQQRNGGGARGVARHIARIGDNQMVKALHASAGASTRIVAQPLVERRQQSYHEIIAGKVAAELAQQHRKRLLAAELELPEHIAAPRRPAAGADRMRAGLRRFDLADRCALAGQARHIHHLLQLSCSPVMTGCMFMDKAASSPALQIMKSGARYRADGFRRISHMLSLNGERIATACGSG